MTPDQREYFRQLLEAQRQELLASSDAAKDSTRPVTLDQASVGRLSRMDAMQGQAMAIASQSRRDLQLQHIHAALARMQCGNYGLCIACKEEIAIRRLETDPVATLCIDCASRQERR
ncbi:MAG: TraR/DksA C4-type zinc finger protein [Desulfuromonadales bacterium]|nr:TraR/DksA C4-type zinc finger protein [Desulfuromonadales bacterium]